jgi:hypothetical protein
MLILKFTNADACNNGVDCLGHFFGTILVNLHCLWPSWSSIQFIRKLIKVIMIDRLARQQNQRRKQILSIY